MYKIEIPAARDICVTGQTCATRRAEATALFS